MSAFSEAYYKLFPPPSVRSVIELDRLRQENAYLRSIIAQWQKNCTGMHGSQKPCGLSADPTASDAEVKP